ncbi:DNA topoisomerase III [Hydrogenophaga sp. 2FB]|uniref:DNA topoisomerase III n=1 Tax=Hydrogenophaga sp. 2FB TaxID=2502187 RepID=UPI0010F5E903|nr:DNA topoisomerase III [Hydrogenophaga sp. 2FB]
MPSFNRLFIAEKPSAARTLADFLARSQGIKAQAFSTHIVVGEDALCWERGHLLELVDADHYDPRFAKWRFDDLPIIPNEFILAPKRDMKGNRAGANAHIAAIGKLLKECQTVVGFGDPDAEGQMIQDEILIYLKNRKPVIRLWASALDDSSLTKALAAMKPNVEYLGWYEQAMCRSHSDWLYGINMTRACTIHARNAGATSPVYIGRVQTPTLALVVNRELEILNFKSVDYFVPQIALATDPGFKATWMPRADAKGEVIDPRVNDEKLLTNKADAEAIIDLVKRTAQARVLVAKTEPGTESAPLPFALSGLQSHCSKLYGLGATQTLEVVQSLYEKKLASYPRVDTEYLPEDQHADAPKIIASLAKASLPVAIGNALVGARPSLKSRAWNDAKVTAHHAIVPTMLDNPGEIARLSEIELKVYCEIVKRYVLQFWPQAKFMATELVLGVGTGGQMETFGAKGRRYVDDGWRKAFSDANSADDDGADVADPVVTLPQLTKDQTIPVSGAGFESKKTKAKKRFTEGTLISAMKNIHQYVTDPEVRKGLREGSGIGTEATRAKIIDTLLDAKRNLMQTKGKELMPTENGMRMIQLLPPHITTPDMTAVWQQFGAAVQARETTYRDFIVRQSSWITKLVKSSSGFFNPSQFPVDPKNPPRAAAQDTDHECFGLIPTAGCGSKLRLISGQYGPFYKCTNDKCGKTFRQVEGAPQEKTPGGARNSSTDLEAYKGQKYKCKRCEQGSLLKKARRDNTGSFWGCSHWRDADGGCKAAYNDHEGKPDFEGVTKKGGGGRGAANSGGFAPKPANA